MNRRSHIYRLTRLALVAALATWTLACGGGGGGNVVTPPPMGLTASFTPDNANPGPNTLNMTATPTGGANFTIEINVTDITDFFGAGFRVTYDPATAQYVGFSSTGSTLVLNTPVGATTDFRVDPRPGGELWIDATLQGQVQGITVPVNVTELLLTLSFSAIGATNGNAFGFDVPATRVVTTCPAPPTACSDIAVNWSGGTMRAN